MEGQRISSYRIVRKVGQGGMGAVYEAVHEQLGRRAAIKLLRREMSLDPQISRRFFNEAKAACKVLHPGIIEIFEFGNLPDETAYIIMEFLRGEPLSARLRSLGGKLPIADAVRIGRQIASALAATHEQGIIHRDLKPDNVMLVPDSEVPGGERVKILDFGIAKDSHAYDGPGSEDFMTGTGVVLGTASYMAPEQCKGAGSVTDKADVYSLGCVMYRLLCGQLPFRAEGQGEVMAMQIFSRHKPLAEQDPTLPQPLTALVERMLSKDANERPTMAEVATELESHATFSGQQRPVVTISSPAGDTSGQSTTLPTLSAALGQSDILKAVETPPRSRKWLAVPFALVMLAGAGAGARYALTRPPPPPPPKEQPAPAMVAWSLSSDPAGARVVRKDTGAELGRTPWNLPQPKRQGTILLAVQADGYEEMVFSFDESRDMVTHAVLKPLTGAVVDLGAATKPASPETPVATGQPEVKPAGKPDGAVKPQPTGQPGFQRPRPRPVGTGQKPSGGVLTDDDVDLIK